MNGLRLVLVFRLPRLLVSIRCLPLFLCFLRLFLTYEALAKLVAAIKVPTFNPFEAPDACLHRACRDAQGGPSNLSPLRRAKC